MKYAFIGEISNNKAQAIALSFFISHKAKSMAIFTGILVSFRKGPP